MRDQAKAREYHREWRRNNPEKIKVYGEAWRAKNPDQKRQNSLNWRANNLAHARAASLQWARDNKGRKRETDLARKYGLTVAQYNEMLRLQGNACAACLVPFGSSRPAVDHCHRMGNVRGLLCTGCNFAIGCAHDNPVTLRRLALYLEKAT